MARKDTAATQAPKETRNPFKRTYDVYKTVKMIDPKVGLWMLLAFAVVIAVGLLIGWLTGHPWLTLIVAIPAALLAAMVILARRGEAAAFAQMEGQKGATLGGLKMMRRGWYYDEEPVAADAAKANEIHNAAVVFRAVGKPGVVLFGEGPHGRAAKLLEKEKKKVARVAPGVPIHTFHVGSEEGELTPKKMRWTLTRLKPALSKEEMSVVLKRLRSLPGIRQGVPAGVDPTSVRMNRKALRGK
ncbi:DUF4191 domain-containing protein [Marihabitans asiaticum]|uniref:Uncharacterized protein DUF4191 n=1 Tax=Marihabitans asiaticum TaxID=415218 RepID=A0A560W7N8_9MICO|nr:DUF4191 domain-containing protein [Marihabitans asiaticum]TWD13624.1 uncharacterized protein DUF4191 [Marihabitans asiaticum]